jgi:transmembrane sensor
MNEARYYDLIGKYLSGELAGEEREMLLAWANEKEENQKLFEELRIIWESSEEVPLEYEVDPKAGWEKLEGKIEEKPVAGAEGQKHGGFRWLRIAAAVLVLLVAGWWAWPKPDTEMVVLTTGENETRQVDLPDGSTISMNEATTLRYSEDFKERKLELSGEAFFEVERDERRPFQILAGETKTLVLGTSFYIRAYPDETRIELRVASGKVAFQDKEEKKEKLVLAKGEQAFFLNDQARLEKIESPGDNLKAWHTRELHFSKTPLAEVLPALERYFGVEMELSDPRLLNCRLSGDYKDPQLDKLLDILRIALQLDDVQQTGNKVLLIGEGC